MPIPLHVTGEPVEAQPVKAQPVKAPVETQRALDDALDWAWQDDDVLAWMTVEHEQGHAVPSDIGFLDDEDVHDDDGLLEAVTPGQPPAGAPSK